MSDRPIPPGFDAAALEIFKHLFASVAEEMGVTLGRTGYSPNIKERRDYSCALFLGDGRMLAQAAHIPVHLGAMPASVRAAVDVMTARGMPFAPGDVVALNDPYLGGTHLPDITLVSPVFFAAGAGLPDFFAASRAHHADVGGMSPGSMPLSTELYQEGLIIPPVKLVEGGRLNHGVFDLIVRNSRTPDERRGDIAAQIAAHQVGARRLDEIVRRYGLPEVQAQAARLIEYAGRLTRAALAGLPQGTYTFEDALDDDGISAEPLPIRVSITLAGGEMIVDFTGTAPAAAGSLNAVRAIVESAVMYVVRCIAGASLPMNHGVFTPVTVRIPPGSLLDPGPPHAVAGGNVETSMRIVDVLYGALAAALPDRIPAASQGTMNNLTFGGIDPRTGAPFAYYETMGGGSGAGPSADGASALHCHMSNTLNTPIEALEMALPVRIRRYAVRRGSGGAGCHRGGDGLIREIEFLTGAQVTILSERRVRPPYGLAGGMPGQPGRNTLLRADGTEQLLPGKVRFDVADGDVLRVETPGGGGWGPPDSSAPQAGKG
ncbi:MAG: hydantoinase B/oxoprolinase family protein [Anaerolineae bacterium]